MIDGFFDKILSYRAARHFPWYALGVLGGSISFMGTSGMGLLYIIFILTLITSCALRSYFDYVINFDSNKVLHNTERMIKDIPIEFSEHDESHGSEKLRYVYTIAVFLQFSAFFLYLVFISIGVNAIIFLNLPVLYTSIGYIVASSFIYFMISFFLNITSIAKFREL